MEEKQTLPEVDIRSILALYGLDTAFGEQTAYIHYTKNDDREQQVKIILSVLLASGKRVVIKLLHEDKDFDAEEAKLEGQSAFSECLRQNGIRTPLRYQANGCYCNTYTYAGLPCHVTIEDWCGEEILEINTDIAYQIGVLLAQMHTLSLTHGWTLGCGTLFSAAYENDVDCYDTFCTITQNEALDQAIAAQLKKLHDEKLAAIRAVWEMLPKAGVQGDISINNLVYGKDELTVFDYNNAGDEVLVSDLVLEGLLTAYEMDLPAGVDESYREKLFPALLDGYLSIRKLSDAEAQAAWLVYTLYHALWFTRVVYTENSLEKLVARKDYAGANQLLSRMLDDMTENDDGRFRK